MNKILFYILLLFAVWFVFLKTDKVVLGPGIMAANPPVQVNLNTKTSFPFKEYIITPLADFKIHAKVLSRENYHLGPEADLSPTDLALGWGRMSDEKVLSDIEISQSGRWYRWYTKTFPIPRREIELSSANMHIIPKDENVADVLESIRAGDIVSIEGSLVKISGDKGWHWNSSLSRMDTGNGACEIIFANDIQIMVP